MISINKIFLVYAIITLQQGWAKKMHLNNREYAKMPPIWHLENYGRCLLEPGDMYCHLIFKLDSIGPSPLLELLKNVSVPATTRFNHLKIDRGICISRSCAQYFDNLTIQNLDEDSFKSIIQTCVNESIWQEYRLEAHLEQIKHCESTEDLYVEELTLAQKLVAFILICIVAMNLIGATYTSYIKRHNISPANKFWMAFSVQENARKVLFGSEKDTENFGSLLGMRFIGAVVAINIHTAFIGLLNVENEQFYEDLFDNRLNSIISNGASLIDMFFVSSGFLLGFSYIKSQSKRKFGGSNKYLCRSIFDRFLRMTPTWAVILAITCTWAPKFGSGPMWHELVEAESMDCRENWWKLLLYIGNFGDFGNKYCMPHAWFLAANMQVHLFSLIFMMFLVRYPKHTRLMFSSAVIIFTVIPSVIIYRQKLLPIFLYSPELGRTSVGSNPHFINVYVTSYGHAGAGIIGLIAGYAHYHIQQKGIDIRTWKVFNFLYKSSLVVILAIVYTGTYFCSENYVYDAFLASAYSAVYRLILSIFLAIIILGAVNGCGRKLQGILEFTPFQVMGRLSFSAYLVHMLPIRQFFGTSTAPCYVTWFTVFIIAMGSLTVTYILAFILSTLVENPVNELRSALTGSSSNKEKEEKTK